MNERAKVRWIRITPLLIFQLALAAEARVTRLVITSREVVADGAFFGDVGPYEKLKGTVYFELNPAHPNNAIVFDLENAPTNERGWRRILPRRPRLRDG